MRVLLADKLSETALKRLTDGHFNVRSLPDLNGEALAAAIADFDPEALVVRSTRVEAQHVTAGRSLTVVIRAGAGVNTIDLAACAAHGVYVSNCPGRNAVAVAELTMGLLVALDRRIAENVIDLRTGRWNKGRYSKANGLKGRTLGILGCGQIGTEVALRARAFGMKVVAWCKDLAPERAVELGIVMLASPSDVAAACDALTVHLAVAPETRGLAGKDLFDAMKPGAFFINTARAEIVDEQALIDAMDAKGLRAAVDVYAAEPKDKEGAISDRLAAHPNVIGTHHIGASTEQAQEAVAAEVCRILEVTRASGHVPNCVNLAKRTSADHLLTVRHRDRVGVLAGILGALRRGNINVEEMENTIFLGGEAASARLQIHGTPSADVLDEIRSNEHVFAATLTDIEA